MNDNDKFKVGDVVVLNSEGPHMTVTHIAPSGACDVSWFSQDGSRGMHDEFPEQCLRLVFRHGDN